MRDAARKYKKSKTIVWWSYRRTPAVALAYQLARAGKIGRIYHVRGYYLQDWAGPDVPLIWRFDKKIAGSGSHGDLGRSHHRHGPLHLRRGNHGNQRRDHRDVHQGAIDPIGRLGRGNRRRSQKRTREKGESRGR